MITPADSPSSPSDYDAVPPHRRGPAPYDIQAQNDEAAITSQFNSATAVAGAGVLYPRGPRQAETETLLTSPQGFATGGYDIDAGTTAGWPANVEPGG